MVYTISEIRELVAHIVLKYHIPALFLFGSYARGEATEDSDIDLLVDTTGTELTSLLRLGALYCDLEDAFSKPIDLIALSSIEQESSLVSDHTFAQAVLTERLRLYPAA